MPTADVGFFSLYVGPLATLIIWCAAMGMVLLLVFGIDVKHEELEPNWGAGNQDVKHGENWRRQSANSIPWAASGHWGPQILEWCHLLGHPPLVACRW